MDELGQEATCNYLWCAYALHRQPSARWPFLRPSDAFLAVAEHSQFGRRNPPLLPESRVGLDVLLHYGRQASRSLVLLSSGPLFYHVPILFGYFHGLIKISALITLNRMALYRVQTEGVNTELGDKFYRYPKDMATSDVGL
ncbi:hypothetical protein PG995_005142 [Apiospora arundinis]